MEPHVSHLSLHLHKHTIATNVALVTPVAWCNYCGTHTTLTGHSEFMEQIESWWKDGTTGEDYEVITGLNESDFNPENDNKEFTDACNAIWNTKSDEEKIEIWKTITHREEYE